MGRAASTLGPFVPPVAASHASLPLSLPPQAPLGLSKLNLVTNEHPKRRQKTSRRKVQGKGGPFHLPTVLPFWRPLGNTEGGFGIPKRCSEKPRVAVGMLAQPLPQGPSIHLVATGCLWHDVTPVVRIGVGHLHYPWGGQGPVCRELVFPTNPAGREEGRAHSFSADAKG